jgi:hypothetical protein
MIQSPMLPNMFSDMSPMFSLIFLIFGFVIIAIGLIWFRKKRLIENIPTSKVRSLAMGLVEIVGQVIPVPERLLKSPFTEEDCVYYHFSVEEYRKSGKNSHWVTIKKGEQRIVFYLKDDTGMVLVDPSGASIDAARDFECQSGFGRDPPDSVIRFLTSQNIAHEGFFGSNRTMRYRETFIAPNDSLYIMGTAGENSLKNQASADHVDNIMIQKGRYEKQYFISDKSEKQLLKNLALQTYGTWGAGIALIVIGIILYLYT